MLVELEARAHTDVVEHVRIEEPRAAGQEELLDALRREDRRQPLALAVEEQLVIRRRLEERHVAMRVDQARQHPLAARVNPLERTSRGVAVFRRLLLGRVPY